MFGGKFSLIRFGLKDQPRPAHFSLFSAARFNGTVGASKKLPFRLLSCIECRMEACAVYGLPFQMKVETQIQASATGGVLVYFSLLGKGSFFCQASGGKLIFFSLRGGEAVKCSAVPGKLIWFSADAKSAVSCRAVPGKNIYFPVFPSEIVSARVSSYSLETQTAVLTLSIPPGGTLVLDTENFNVYLNGKNVIHLHSGDWPTIDRDAIEMEIDSGTGGALTGILLYKEAYL